MNIHNIMKLMPEVLAALKATGQNVSLAEDLEATIAIGLRGCTEPSDEEIYEAAKGFYKYECGDNPLSGIADFDEVGFARDLLARYSQPAQQECGCCGRSDGCDPDCDAAQPAASLGPVGRVKTIGGHPDESAHKVDWLVKHKELRDGDLLYAAPVAASAEPAMYGLRYAKKGIVAMPLFYSHAEAEKYLDSTAKLAALTWERPEIVPLYTGPVATQPIVPDGWRLVPIEPTREMTTAGKHTIKGADTTFERILAEAAYSSMLAAAPTPPAADQAQQDAKVDALVEAAQAMADDYKQLADSGDAGFWKAEDQVEYANLVKAIAAVRTQQGGQP